MLKKILAIAFKDNVVRFSSPGEWLFCLILPVIFSVVISFATGSQNDSRIALLVVDQDGGELARDLIEVLKDSKTIAVKEYNLSEAEDKFRDREGPAILVIPPGVAAAQEAYVLEAKEKAEELFDDQPERILVSGPALKKEQDFWSPATQASAGTIVTWVFIPLLAISEFFALERQLGTMRRLLSAPVSKAVYLLGTISGQLGPALLQLLRRARFRTRLLGVSWWHDPLASLVIF